MTSKLLHITPDILLDLATDEEFYNIPEFSPLYASVEKMYNRMISEQMLNQDGSLNKEGCVGCKARQFKDAQNNIIDTIMNALIQLSAAGRRSALNSVKELLTKMGKPAEEVQIEYSGPCTKKKPHILRF